jgi:hypothetical protein
MPVEPPACADSLGCRLQRTVDGQVSQKDINHPRRKVFGSVKVKAIEVDRKGKASMDPSPDKLGQAPGIALAQDPQLLAVTDRRGQEGREGG